MKEEPHGNHSLTLNKKSISRQQKVSKKPSEIKLTAQSSYDKNLLERSRTQWQFCDWDSLALLDHNTLQHHPDRAMLALFAAVGRLQIDKDNCNEAKLFIHLALNWGIDKKEVSRMLIAAVHDTLGRVAAIAGDSPRAIKHFENAIDIGGMPGVDKALLVRARIYFQCGQAEHSEIVSLMTSDLHYHIVSDSFEDCSSITSDQLPSEFVLNHRNVTIQTVGLGDIKFNIFHRPESKGDIGSIEQCLINLQYNVEWLPQGKSISRLYNSLIRSGKLPLIIDAGANIGASCQWFHAIYPKARILAIEPDEDNCELLRKNCAGLPVHLYCGALADRQRTLKFSDPGESDWGFRVGLSGERDVNCIGPMDIMTWCNKQSYIPLIFKCDIEGSEELLFSGNCYWLSRIPMLIVELHDWLFPNGNTSRNFKKVIAQFDMQFYTRGENIFCFNKSLI